MLAPTHVRDTQIHQCEIAFLNSQSSDSLTNGTAVGGTNLARLTIMMLDIA